MVSTEVELCNQALSHLGESRITDLTEANERARLCNALYDGTRDELLAMFEWPFAIERVALASVSETNLTHYEYRYALPNDFLLLLDALDDENYNVIALADYRIEGNRLLCDYSPLYIRYIKRITIPGLMPEAFVLALSLALAAKLAPRLSQNFNLAMQMSTASANALLRAKSELMMAAKPRQRGRDITGRRTGLWSSVGKSGRSTTPWTESY